MICAASGLPAGASAGPASPNMRLNSARGRVMPGLGRPLPCHEWVLRTMSSDHHHSEAASDETAVGGFQASKAAMSSDFSPAVSTEGLEYPMAKLDEPRACGWP